MPEAQEKNCHHILKKIYYLVERQRDREREREREVLASIVLLPRCLQWSELSQTRVSSLELDLGLQCGSCFRDVPEQNPGIRNRFGTRTQALGYGMQGCMCSEQCFSNDTKHSLHPHYLRFNTQQIWKVLGSGASLEWVMEHPVLPVPCGIQSCGLFIKEWKERVWFGSMKLSFPEVDKPLLILIGSALSFSIVKARYLTGGIRQECSRWGHKLISFFLLQSSRK